MQKTQYTIAEISNLTGWHEKRIRNIVTNNQLKTSENGKHLMTIAFADFFDCVMKDKDDEKAWKIRKLKAEALQVEAKLKESEVEVYSQATQSAMELLHSYIASIRGGLASFVRKYPQELKAVQDACTKAMEETESNITIKETK